MRSFIGHAMVGSKDESGRGIVEKRGDAVREKTDLAIDGADLERYCGE